MPLNLRIRVKTYEDWKLALIGEPSFEGRCKDYVISLFRLVIEEKFSPRRMKDYPLVKLEEAKIVKVKVDDGGGFGSNSIVNLGGFPFGNPKFDSGSWPIYCAEDFLFRGARGIYFPPGLGFSWAERQSAWGITEDRDIVFVDFELVQPDGSTAAELISVSLRRINLDFLEGYELSVRQMLRDLSDHLEEMVSHRHRLLEEAEARLKPIKELEELLRDKILALGGGFCG